MPADLPPEHVLGQLEAGSLSPLYLFHGASEFQREKVLSRIRETYIPEGARDLNLHLFYGDDRQSDPARTVSAVVDAARSLPFISTNRLIIVRRVEGFPASALEGFLPYLDAPVPSTTLIFVAEKPDFRKKFYREIRAKGLSINFRKLYDTQVVPWIKRTARGLGLAVSDEGCAYLYQVVGNRLGELHSELEKLHLRHGRAPIGLEEVQALVRHSRTYSIFELVDDISSRRCGPSLAALKRFIEREGKDSVLGAVGMLNRQMRLLWQTKSIVAGGGHRSDVARELSLQDFLARKLEQQAGHWRSEDLEAALEQLYRADRLLKSGAQGHLVMEQLVVSLCA